MSHFTVLVIGDNPEAQLEPFWELDLSPEEAAEDPRAEFTDCTDEVVEEWENGGTDMYLLPDGSEIRTWEFKIKHALPYFTKEQLIEVLSKTIDSIKTEILLLEEEKPDNLFRSGFISKRIPLLTDILLRINIALKCGSGELMFKVAKAKRDFKLGESYRIYHICPTTEGVEYIFQSKGGNLKMVFGSTEEAEAIKIQAEAITQQGGRDYVNLKAVEKWDGKLPTQMIPNATMPFINLTN